MQSSKLGIAKCVPFKDENCNAVVAALILTWSVTKRMTGSSGLLDSSSSSSDSDSDSSSSSSEVWPFSSEFPCRHESLVM